MAKINYPKTVKVLYKHYDLVERSSISEVLEHRNYGNHYEILNRIEWVRTDNESDNVQTIVHELFHALYVLFSIKDSDNEEETVTKLSVGLVTLMKDNKPLFQKLLDSL